MRRLLLLFLFALPLGAQTITNPSFETFNPLTSPNVTVGDYNVGPIPSWTTSTGLAGSWQPTTTAFTAVPDGKTVIWLEGTLVQDLGVAPQAGTIYTLTASVGNRADNPKGVNSTWSLALYAGTKQLCVASGLNSTIPLGTFASQTLSCPVSAATTGNLAVQLSTGGAETVFDNVSLTSVSAVVPQRISLTVKAQLLWCTLCNQTDDLAAAGSLVIAQTNGPTGTFVIQTDGSISASGIIDIAQDPLEFTFWLIDSTGTAQPGASMKLTFPRFELAGPSFTLGTFSLGVVRIAHTTDSKGNPAVRLASIDQFKLL